MRESKRPSWRLAPWRCFFELPLGIRRDGYGSVTTATAPVIFAGVAGSFAAGTEFAFRSDSRARASFPRVSGGRTSIEGRGARVAGCTLFVSNCGGAGEALEATFCCGFAGVEILALARTFNPLVFWLPTGAFSTGRLELLIATGGEALEATCCCVFAAEETLALVVGTFVNLLVAWLPTGAFSTGRLELLIVIDGEAFFATLVAALARPGAPPGECFGALSSSKVLIILSTSSTVMGSTLGVGGCVLASVRGFETLGIVVTAGDAAGFRVTAAVVSVRTVR